MSRTAAIDGGDRKPSRCAGLEDRLVGARLGTAMGDALGLPAGCRRSL
jgi:hypothetical protein